jgi:DNA-binding NarL/FixJ family response regulator
MKVLLVDDHALFREGLRVLLERLEQDYEIFEAGDCAGFAGFRPARYAGHSGDSGYAGSLPRCASSRDLSG